MKYNLPGSEGEVLPNLLGITEADQLALSEFEGFLKAEILFTEKLSSRTKFNARYVLRIHSTALGHLYSFAGKYRDVNLSKGGFPFAAARFLSESMNAFDKEILSLLPSKYADERSLIRDIAKVHAELLFIHPFREGNGRTARILANLMCRKQGYGGLDFSLINEIVFEQYVHAVQAARDRNYSPMESIIYLIFPK